MHSSFIVAVIMTTFAAYLSQHSPEAVSLFFMVLAVLGLIISFVLAPWMMQILFLVFGLLWMRYLCRKTGCDKSTLNQ